MNGEVKSDGKVLGDEVFEVKYKMLRRLHRGVLRGGRGGRRRDRGGVGGAGAGGPRVSGLRLLLSSPPPSLRVASAPLFAVSATVAHLICRSYSWRTSVSLDKKNMSNICKRM